MGREFDVDATDTNIGPLVKAEACYEAAAASLAMGATESGEKLLFRAMQLYDMAERPDKVLVCAKALKQADPQTTPDLYRQAAEFYFRKSDDKKASEIVLEAGLTDILDEFQEQILLD